MRSGSYTTLTKWMSGVIELWYEGYERSSFLHNLCILCSEITYTLGSRNLAPTTRPWMCTIVMASQSSRTNLSFRGPNLRRRGGILVHTPQVSYRASPHHMRGTRYTAGRRNPLRWVAEFCYSRHAHRQLATCALDLCLGFSSYGAVWNALHACSPPTVR